MPSGSFKYLLSPSISPGQDGKTLLKSQHWTRGRPGSSQLTEARSQPSEPHSESQRCRRAAVSAQAGRALGAQASSRAAPHDFPHAGPPCPPHGGVAADGRLLTLRKAGAGPGWSPPLCGPAKRLPVTGRVPVPAGFCPRLCTLRTLGHKGDTGSRTRAPGEAEPPASSHFTLSSAPSPLPEGLSPRKQRRLGLYQIPTPLCPTLGLRW